MQVRGPLFAAAKMALAVVAKSVYSKQPIEDFHSFLPYQIGRKVKIPAFQIILRFYLFLRIFINVYNQPYLLDKVKSRLSASIFI